MTLSVFPACDARHKAGKGKVTCVTCKLKGCVGRCQFQVVNAPPPTKAA
jgi:hypothetical protein